MSLTNEAAWLPSLKSPLVVKEAPFPVPRENEIVVKNAAVAINPLDHLLQSAGSIFSPWIKYPFIIGTDVSGTVHSVGPSVTRFKTGDRVVGHAVGTDKRSNKSSEGAFQRYTVLRTNLVAPIPDFMSFEEACVLPLGLSTASCGLFMKDFLALDLPKVETKKGSKGETLLVWGGSTSVGCNAIQLAMGAGYEVIATASPKNHEYLKTLGASQVFDYKSATVVKDIISAIKSKTVAGAMAIGLGSTAACIEILGSCKNGRKFVAQATFDLPASGFPKNALDWPLFGMAVGYGKVSTAIKSKARGVDFKFIWGSDNMANEVGKTIYEDFLPRALEEEKFVAAPKPLVVGKGLEIIQEAMEINKNGVSAEKVVVTL